ncbi:MAG: hypothetical protein H8D58_04345, partial [Candidatus Marinimicrobia bacterium]|nr:hypothetical protein [Candidatus Neomarinimicrobiota bacterium]
MKKTAVIFDIDGATEICESVWDSVFKYHMDQDFDQDIQNFKEAVLR